MFVPQPSAVPPKPPAFTPPQPPVYPPHTPQAWAQYARKEAQNKAKQIANVTSQQAVSYTSLVLYFIYTGLIGVSLFYATKLHTLIVHRPCDPNSSAPPSISSEQKRRADNALYLAISYTVILCVFMIGYLTYTVTTHIAANLTVLAVFGFIIFFLQLVSFGMLNQDPAYEFARNALGKDSLIGYRATNGLGIVFSIFIIGINGYFAWASRPKTT